MGVLRIVHQHYKTLRNPRFIKVLPDSWSYFINQQTVKRCTDIKFVCNEMRSVYNVADYSFWAKLSKKTVRQMCSVCGVIK
jgi:hypothetical protein